MTEDRRPPVVHIVRPEDLSLSAIAGVEAHGERPEVGVQDLLHWKHGRDGKKVYPLPKALNAVRILRHDSRWSGRLVYDAFRLRSFLLDEDGSPQVLRDADEYDTALWLDEVYGLTVEDRAAGKAMARVARENEVHPVKEYLDGLTWDGVERLPTMLSHYWRASTSELIGQIGVCWMISCVARIYAPGCKVDTTLIFVGEQGSGKSTSIQHGLCPHAAWFGDAALDFSGRDKDSLMQIAGKWIYEIAELTGLHRREARDIKAFLSRQKDEFRPPYGRHVAEYPRQCVFVGTTNETQILSDPTGSRRFWPVRVGRSRLAELQRDRDQLWAEAKVRYQRGEQWHLSEDYEVQLRQANEEFQQQDPQAELILNWLEGRPASQHFTMSELMKEALDIPTDRQDKRRQVSIAKILPELGIQRAGRVTRAGRKVRVWKHVQEQAS